MMRVPTNMRMAVTPLLIVAVLSVGLFPAFAYGQGIGDGNVVGAHASELLDASTVLSQEIGTKTFAQGLDAGDDPEFIDKPAGFTQNPVPPKSAGNSGKGKNTDCAVIVGSGTFGNCILQAIAGIVEKLMQFSALILWASGLLLNEAIEFTVFKAANLIGGSALIVNGKVDPNKKGSDALSGVWTQFRNLGNLVLIFGFIAIALATILGIEQYGAKKLLATLIIVAVLLNFSLFFSKVVIDVSNVIALNFWSAIDTSQSGNLSGSMMSFLRLQTVYDSQNSRGFIVPTLPRSGRDFQVVNQRTNSIVAAGNLSLGDIILIGGIGTVLFAITAFVFISAAILFVIRFAVLALLMVVSPLAFAAMAIPAVSGLATRWWRMLFSYSFIAPAFFLLLWVSINILKGAGIGSAGNPPLLYTVAQSEYGKALLNFLVVIILLIATLLVSKQMGVMGSQSMISMGSGIGKGIGKRARKTGIGAGRGLAGFAGRNTLGRFARGIRESAATKELAAKIPLLGSSIERGLDRVAGASFGGRAGGRNKALKDSVARQRRLRDYVAEETPVYQGDALSDEEYQAEVQRQKTLAKKRRERVEEGKGLGGASKEGLSESSRVAYRELQKDKEKRERGAERIAKEIDETNGLLSEIANQLAASPQFNNEEKNQMRDYASALKTLADSDAPASQKKEARETARGLRKTFETMRRERTSVLQAELNTMDRNAPNAQGRMATLLNEIDTLKGSQDFQKKLERLQKDQRDESEKSSKKDDSSGDSKKDDKK